MIMQIKRGDVYIAELDPVVGSEQGGCRPVLIVQADRGLRNAPTAVVLPITSQTKPALPTHAFLVGASGLSAGSIALAEQIRTLDKTRLRKRIGTVEGFRMAEVDTALKYTLGLMRAVPASSPEVKTLCSRCKQDYESAGYVLKRIGKRDGPKSTCDFCNTGQGYDFEVVCR